MAALARAGGRWPGPTRAPPPAALVTLLRDRTPAKGESVEAVVTEKGEIDPKKVHDREGILKKTPLPDSGEAQTGYWPWSMDYWGIMRTDLEELLKPYAGRTVRVEGEFRKIYAHDRYIYEVDPVRI